MAVHRYVEQAAWPCIITDLKRLGATVGEVRRIEEMLACGIDDVAFSLVEAILHRLRTCTVPQKMTPP